MAGTATTESSTAAAPGARRALSARWGAIHEAAQEIGQMAALAPEPLEGRLAHFPAMIEEAGGARLALAQDGIADLDAILQPGLAALRTIAARGQDTTAAALALWREFHALRSALLDLAEDMSARQPSLTA